MELNNLYGFTLLVILVGMLIGVGALALDKFGDAAKTDTAISESIAIAGQAGTTANDEVVSLQAFYNASQTWVVNDNVNVTLESGAIITTTSVTNGTYTINYTYEADSEATTTAGTARTEVANIASNWLGLIVTIAILAIIMGLVIRGFGYGRR